jgi:hypothetical protein
MRSNLILTAAILAAAVCSTCSATTLERLSMGDMTDQATVVVRATVSGDGVGELSNGAVSTHYQLNITEVWKGAAGAKIDVYVPGGTANGLRQLVPGSPTLVAGVEYVVFLWIGRSGRPQIMGLSQGLFNVTKDAAGAVMVERPGVTESMVDPKTGRPVADETMRMKASDVRTFVQKRQVAK